MKRKDIPEEIREAMGEILEAGYPTAKGLIQVKAAVENAKFFKEVAKRFAKDAPDIGFKQLPKTPRLGALAGKYVPEPIFHSINEIVRPRAGYEKITRPIIATFKYGKVVLNPACHGRNVISNSILNWWKLGIGPWRLDKYAKGLKSIIKKDEWYQRAVQQGLREATYATQELKNILLGPEGMTIGEKLGVKWKQLVRKLADIYQNEEALAKITAFRHFAEKGMADDVVAISRICNI